jgi:signal transduction histidine kinase
LQLLFSNIKKYLSKLFIIILGFTLIIIGKGIQYSSSTSNEIISFASIIESDIYNKQRELLSVSTDKRIFRVLDLMSLGIQTDPNNESIKLLKKDFPVLVYNKDSLIYWSDNKFIPTIEDLNKINVGNQCTLLSNTVGEFVLYRINISSNSNTYKLLGLIPIKYYKYKENVHDYFPASNNIPSKLCITKEVGVPLHDKNNKILCKITAEKDYVSTTSLPFFILFTIFGIFVIIFGSSKIVLDYYNVKRKRNYGALFFILQIIIVRYTIIWVDYPKHLSNNILFQKVFNSNSVFSNSVMDLLVNTIILLWVSIFIYKYVKTDFERLIKKNNTLIVFLLYSIVTISLIIIIGIFNDLVLNSEIPLDFDNIFNLNIESMISLLAVGLSILSLFFISYRSNKEIKKISISNGNKWLAMIAGVLIIVPLSLFYDLKLPLIWSLFILFSFNYTFSYFIENKNPGLIWLVLWLIILSSLSGSILFKYNGFKELNQKVEWANQIQQLQNENNTYFSHVQNIDIQSIKNRLDSLVKINLKSNFQKYSYTILRGSNIVLANEENNQIPDVIFLSNLDLGSVSKIEYKGFETIINKSKSNTIVIVQKSSNGLIKYLSLFSYLFILMTFILVLFVILNSLFRILPNFLIVQKDLNFSIGSRIQLPMLGLILLSFIIIGLVTVLYFDKVSKTRYEENVLSALSRIINNTNQILQEKEDVSMPQLINYTKLLSENHQMETVLFDKSGNLIFSTLMNTDIGMKKIIPQAYYHLKQGNTFFKVSKSLNGISYNTAFVRLQDKTSNMIGILELPYYTKLTEIKAEVSDFLGTLITVYIFLLLIASSITITLTKNITKPIAAIGDKLKKFKLGIANEKLEWKTKDEIGELVNEYNNLVEKLEESATKLAEQERESAWREMAQQVAHEIRNPLTPMKMVVQHLDITQRNEPHNVELYLARSTKVLLDQIATLEHVVNEFADLARMPQAVCSEFLLNEIVKEYETLYEDYNDYAAVKVTVPDSPLFIFADQKLLINAINNLVKNAIESIPSDRYGKVDIFLYEKDKKAIIQITDNGSGIPDDLKDLIFKPKFTTKSYGDGIGLLITKNIINSVNGKIRFETEEGMGTSFFIEFDSIKLFQKVIS